MGSHFVHLHVHTQFSLLDGACHVDRLVKKAAKLGMPALAMTDHGNMFGAVKFCETCQKVSKDTKFWAELGKEPQKIKPIIGAEVYVAEKSRHDRDNNHKIHHLVLFVKDKVGYQNLIRLTSLSYLEGFYYKPRIDKELLEKHHDGLIASSACLKGEVAYWLVQGQYQKALETALWYRGLFGSENYYLEIMENGIPEQRIANQGLLKISRETGIPLIATNDVHYIEREHSFAHEVLVCLQTGHKLSDEKRMKMTEEAFYFKTQEEMEAEFPYAPEAITNTMKIADACNFEFEKGKYHMPQFPLPPGKTDAQYLEELCREALPRFYPNASQEVEDRLRFELDTIVKMGFASYFLIVWDLIYYARTHGITVGPGRGSAAGSIVSYLLQITQLCPLKYNLLFERFLNPNRVSMPDVDIDFCFVNRYKIMEYVAQRYGQDRIAQIVTFGTLQAKAVVRDVARVLDINFTDSSRIAGMIPQGTPDEPMSLKRAIEINPDLKAAMDNDPTVRKLIETAMVLEGLSRHTGVHAAGTVIGDMPLIDCLPLYKTNEDQIVTGYEMKALDGLGMLKMDFLGLRTLTLIDDAVRIIKETRGIEIDWEKIPLDDKPMYEMLSRGEAIGVFQLESGGMRELLRKFKPEVFEDLIAILALYRPGPLGSGMVDDFVLRKQGVNPVTYMVPQLESILKETYGVIVYQEQVMQISSRLGGFTLAQADELRRAMGKKDKKTLDAKREEFLAGSRANAIDDDTANQIYDLMCKFAEYGFNKSHSAAYALVTYRTAYLKANYLVEFVAALLTSEKGNTDKLVEYIAEAKDLGLTVLAPDVNQSGANFTVTGEKEIRFGLSAIKNVGEGPVADIIAARANGAFKDLFDFCSRVDVKTTNKKVMESLIKAGALDAFGKRAAMMECYGRVCDAAARVQEERTSDQFSLFGAFGGDSRELFASDVKVPDKPEWDKETFLQNEKEMLGFYLSGHPLENYANLLRCTNLVSTANIVNHQLDSKGDDEETYVTIACVLEKVKISTTKKEKKMMAVVRLEDGTSHIEAVAFPKTYDRVKEALVEGNKVLVSGSVKQEEEQARVFLNDVVPLSQLYDKLTVLSIYLDENDRAAVAQIKDIFAKYPGKTEVHIHFRSPELRFVRIKPKNDYFVMPREELLGELMALLGKEKVKVAMAENPERKRFKKRWDGNRGGGSGDE